MRWVDEARAWSPYMWRITWLSVALGAVIFSAQVIQLGQAWNWW